MFLFQGYRTRYIWSPPRGVSSTTFVAYFWLRVRSCALFGITLYRIHLLLSHSSPFCRVRATSPAAQAAHIAYRHCSSTQSSRNKLRPACCTLTHPSCVSSNSSAIWLTTGVSLFLVESISSRRSAEPSLAESTYSRSPAFEPPSK